MTMNEGRNVENIMQEKFVEEKLAWHHRKEETNTVIPHHNLNVSHLFFLHTDSQLLVT